MTEEATRLAVSERVAAQLRRLYSDADTARVAADIYLTAVCDQLGVDRASVVRFDGDTDELVLEGDPSLDD